MIERGARAGELGSELDIRGHYSLLSFLEGKRKLRAGFATAAALATVAGGVALARNFGGPGHEASAIVAGVPGEVEANDGYHVRIEQCPQDVRAVLGGAPPPTVGSFDPAVGKYAPGCVVDTVAAIIPEAQPGQIITFGGVPGARLPK